VKVSLGIYDNDGVNPYARELANVCERLGYKTEIFSRKSSTKTNQCIMKGNFKPLVRHAAFLKFITKASRKNVNIICWASSKQKIVLIFLLILMRPNMIYVCHNPVPGRAPTGLKGLIERLLISQCTNVVHGDSISKSFLNLYGRKPIVAFHPPYMSILSAAQNMNFPDKLGGGYKNITMIGRNEKNKNFPLDVFTSQILEKCPGFRVIIAQRPRIELENSSDRLINISSDQPLSDTELQDLLRSTSLLVSPSSNVTESGTVILANTLSIKCVAFDSPELRKHLKPHALAEQGNLEELVQACVAATTTENYTTSIWTPTVWFEKTCTSWQSAIDYSMSGRKTT
jgi:hypothetical protein